MPHSSLLTRCPNCQTQFRVTEEQLGIANGKVRCGNCMEIFNAVQHQTITTSSRAAPAQPETAEPEASEPAPASGFTADDFVFEDNPEEDATERGYTGSHLAFSNDELSDSFREAQEGSFTGFEADHHEESLSEVDESWAEAILEDTPTAPEPVAETPQPAKPDTARTPRPATKKAATPERREPTLDEPRLELEPQPLAAASKPSSAPMSSAPTSSAPTSSAPASEPSPEPAPAAPSELTMAKEPNAQDQSTKSEPPMPAKPYQELAREPIAVAPRPRGGWLRTTLWSLLVLGLLAALGAQVGYYQFDRLSAIPELRPYYETACQYAGCELKPLVDVNQIQSRKLVVRTAPDNRAALIVDAEIINRAPFDQPFPAIALTFSNLNGDVVAQRVFPPETYLAGQAQELSTMPKGVPVRIAIQIRDPGRDAVNYNIVFRPYTP
ncbi:DUF3426 domain-containing protein [Marinobacter sp. SS21]|uniref:DUF3426 domain-containing protein n=1 Tax=Marinobacter sp. SS21 TaxID=2979460 RepID=UPI00232F04BB|nr:DUF3426 domain-containing protein [Marinobacter sp. SS21]MDC0662404.1 DUF3426 domain-containing protein [Marinobacter sp. SS21]